MGSKIKENFKVESARTITSTTINMRIIPAGTEDIQGCEVYYI